MRIRKITAALLATALIFMLFTGCSGNTVSPLVSASPSATAEDSETSESGSTLNIEGAYASLDPDTVMMTVDGTDITWDELFYLINYSVTSLQSQVGEISDWSAAISEDITYEQYALDTAVDYVLQDAAIEYGATELGLTLTDEEEAAIQSEWDTQVEASGSEEAFVAQLEAQYCTKEIYMKLVRTAQLAQACFTQLYGENGSNLADDEIADYVVEDGYLMAKHILMLTTKTDDSGNSVDMTEEEKAEILENMEALLDELNNYDGDDFDAYFDELMNANSEDPGVISFPQGYLFQSGEMVTEFEDATVALDIGEISDIVETDYGYHIIYRIPINYEVTPMAYSNYGTYSLRYITAMNMYNSIRDIWFSSMTVEYSDAYNDLDFSKIFAAG